MAELVDRAVARLATVSEELLELSSSHAMSPAWAAGGIAALVLLCRDPAAAADAACALSNLSVAADSNDNLITEAGAIPALVLLLSSSSKL